MWMLDANANRLQAVGQTLDANPCTARWSALRGSQTTLSAADISKSSVSAGHCCSHAYQALCADTVAVHEAVHAYIGLCSGHAAGV